MARGERVCVHYVVGCGKCKFCLAGSETYCRKCQMVGKDLDGVFAEYLKVPAGNVLALPETVPFDTGPYSDAQSQQLTMPFDEGE